MHQLLLSDEKESQKEMVPLTHSRLQAEYSRIPEKQFLPLTFNLHLRDFLFNPTHEKISNI